ncbi:MAG: hypothetical protein Q9202_005437 [Teloschistes flavicans]
MPLFSDPYLSPRSRRSSCSTPHSRHPHLRETSTRTDHHRYDSHSPDLTNRQAEQLIQQTSLTPAVATMPLTGFSTPHRSLPPPPGPPPTCPLPPLPLKASTRDPSPTPKDVAQLYEQYSWPTLDFASLKEKLEDVARASDQDDKHDACTPTFSDIETSVERDTSRIATTQTEGIAHDHWAEELEVFTTARNDDGVYDGDVETETKEDSQIGISTPHHSSRLTQTEESDQESDYSTASEGEDANGSLSVKYEPSSMKTDDSDDEDFAQADQIDRANRTTMEFQEWGLYMERLELEPRPPLPEVGNEDVKIDCKPSGYPESMPLLDWFPKPLLKWFPNFQPRMRRCEVGVLLKLTSKGRLKYYNLSISPDDGNRDSSFPTGQLRGFVCKDDKIPTEIAPVIKWASGFETQMRARSVFTIATVAKNGQVVKLAVIVQDLRSGQIKHWSWSDSSDDDSK